MNNRIHKLFSLLTLRSASSTRVGNILSVFYTPGFPRIEDTVPIAIALANSGVDMIEIGIPFSDPIADGPVIQHSNKVALENGMSVTRLLSQVTEIRKAVDIPIILMGYINPVLQYGLERFCADAKSAGVDGLILPDLPFDEYETDYKSIIESSGLLTIFLIAPTTSVDRIRRIDEASNGFIYAVSASGTTGNRGDFTTDHESYFKKLKELNLRNPFLVGFGISNHRSFSIACQYGAGAIVGSAMISMLKNSSDFGRDIPDFVGTLRGVNAVPAVPIAIGIAD